MAFHVVIPARYASSRLPGKPLLEIAGKPMIQHVYERAAASGAASVVVATDDQQIAVGSTFHQPVFLMPAATPAMVTMIACTTSSSLFSR